MRHYGSLININPYGSSSNSGVKFFSFVSDEISPPVEGGLCLNLSHHPGPGKAESPNSVSKKILDL